MKNIIITGGAGFIGYNLCKRLLNEGNHVVCIDNLYSSNKDNLKGLLNNKNFEYFDDDIRHLGDYTYNHLNVLCIDEIYNLACPASPKFYQKDPIFTITTNILGSKEMLDIARDQDCKILQASTSEIYGNPIFKEQSEDYFGNVNPIGIRACYDEGKRAAECLFFDYNREYNVKIKVARIFNTYGPGMNVDDGRVISNFIVQALKGENLTIYGDGFQTRSFCYIDDMVDGLIKLMNSNDDIVGPINLGNPQEITISTLVNRILNKLELSNKHINLDLPEDDPSRRKPSIKLAKDLLNWEPKVTLDEGLTKTVEYFKGKLNV